MIDATAVRTTSWRWTRWLTPRSRSALVVDETRTRTLLTLHPRVGRWLHLGGHLESGDESVAAAALREVREETGLATALLASLGGIDYGFYSRRQRARIRKRVDFFLLEYRSGSPWHFNEEADAVRLVRLSEAQATVTYPGEREIIRRGLAEMSRGIGPPKPVAAAI